MFRIRSTLNFSVTSFTFFFLLCDITKAFHEPRPWIKVIYRFIRMLVRTLKMHSWWFDGILILLLLQSFLAHGSDNKKCFNGKNDCYANEFPSLEDSVEMIRLSKLVYHFRHENETYCETYSDDNGVSCEWYHHSHILGTQVLLVSNPLREYVAIVFAGTDDLRTLLEDLHNTWTVYGDNSTTLGSDVKVHSGFNNAVFKDGMWDMIYTKFKEVRQKYPKARIFTTGHSLGGANSILTATALANQGHQVTSISIGTPKTGNQDWRQYFENNQTKSSLLSDRLGIWRFVLGLDLIPRLPDLFNHVGHTLQLNFNKDNDTEVKAYYQHYGDPTLHYAGVPSGWNFKPHWSPSAMTYHFATKYIEHLDDLVNRGIWVNAFEKLVITFDDDDDDVNPPDDLYEADYE